MHIFVNFVFKINVNSSDDHMSYLETHGLYSIDKDSFNISLLNWRARQGLSGSALWEIALELDSRLPSDLYSKKKDLFLFLKERGEKLRIEEGQHEGCCQVRLYYADFFPCSTLYGLYMPKHDLKEYSHKMSKFYYFLNPSGNLRLLLSSCCPIRIDELMNAWSSVWVFSSSHSRSLGRFLKDEGRTRREG